jgi:hypothetical protein
MHHGSTLRIKSAGVSVIGVVEVEPEGAIFLVIRTAKTTSTIIPIMYLP